MNGTVIVQEPNKIKGQNAPRPLRVGRHAEKFKRIFNEVLAASSNSPYYGQQDGLCSGGLQVTFEALYQSCRLQPWASPRGNPRSCHRALPLA